MKKEAKLPLPLSQGNFEVTSRSNLRIFEAETDPFHFRYDPRFNTWMKIASMNERRAGFHVSAVAAYNRNRFSNRTIANDSRRF